MHQGARRASCAKKVGDKIEDLRMQDGRCFEMLACRRGSREHKNTGANNGSNAERGQRPRSQTFLEPVSRLVCLGNQFINGLSGE